MAVAVKNHQRLFRRRSDASNGIQHDCGTGVPPVSCSSRLTLTGLTPVLLELQSFVIGQELPMKTPTRNTIIPPSTTCTVAVDHEVSI